MEFRRYSSIFCQYSVNILQYSVNVLSIFFNILSIFFNILSIFCQYSSIFCQYSVNILSIFWNLVMRNFCQFCYPGLIGSPRLCTTGSTLRGGTNLKPFLLLGIVFGLNQCLCIPKASWTAKPKRPLLNGMSVSFLVFNSILVVG